MAVQKRRSQVVMSPSYIADLYAGRTASPSPMPAPADADLCDRPNCLECNMRRERAARAAQQEAGAEEAPAGRTFAKPQEARQLEARSRARTLGVRVAVVSEARQYVTASQSVPGQLYTIQRTPAGWACTCDGYLNTNCCKHLGAVERRSEREGWAFGRIAPLAQVARHFPLDAQDLIVRGAVLIPVAPAAPPAPTPLRPRISAREARADLFGAAD